MEGVRKCMGLKGLQNVDALDGEQWRKGLNKYRHYLCITLFLVEENYSIVESSK